MFYPFSIKINKCSGICNNISDPYAKLCVPDVVKSKCQSIQFDVMEYSNKTHRMT